MATNELNITEKVARFYIGDAYNVEGELQSMNPNVESKSTYPQYYYFTTKTGDWFCVKVEDDGTRIVVSRDITDNPIEAASEISYEIVYSDAGERCFTKTLSKQGIDRSFYYSVDSVGKHFDLLNPIINRGFANRGFALVKNQFPLEIASAYLELLGIRLEGDQQDWQTTSDGNGYTINEGNGKQIGIKLALDIESFPYISVKIKDSGALTNEYDVTLHNEDEESQLQVTTRNYRTHIPDSEIKSLLDINKSSRKEKEDTMSISEENEVYHVKAISKQGVKCLCHYAPKANGFFLEGMSLAENQLSREQAIYYLGTLEIVPNQASQNWETTSDGNGYTINEGNGKQISIKLALDIERSPYISVKIEDSGALTNEYDVVLITKEGKSQLQVTGTSYSTYALDDMTPSLVGANISPSAGKRPYQLVR